MNKQTFAKSVSMLFNPLWIGGLSFLILVLWKGYSLTLALSVLTSAFIATVILPVTILTWFTAQGKIENIDVPERGKRLLPFFIFTIIYAFDALVNYLLQFPMLFQYIIWIILFNTVIYGIITIWWKVSIHAAGIAGYIITIMFILDKWLLWPLLIIILVSWSRVVLHAHTRMQVIIGSLLGIILTYSQLWLFNIFLV